MSNVIVHAEILKRCCLLRRLKFAREFSGELHGDRHRLPGPDGLPVGGHAERAPLGVAPGVDEDLHALAGPGHEPDLDRLLRVRGGLPPG